MKALPIMHITLYQNEVGFFERRAPVCGEEVELSFRVTDMHDILKTHHSLYNTQYLFFPFIES